MATYPGGIPALTNPAGTDNVAGVHAALESAQNDEIEAIATTLGVNPQGPYATDVNHRFQIMDWKRSCRAGSTANIAGTYNNGSSGVGATKAVGGTSLSVDGVTLVNGDRVFLKDQTLPLENGLYIVSGIGTSVVLTRTYDADTSLKMSDNMYVSVEQGATNGDTTWEMTTDNPVTIGTTALRFTRVAPAYQTGVLGSINSNQGPFNPAGCLLENIPRASAPLGNLTPLTTQVIRVFPMGVLKAGQTFTALNYYSATQAAATITASWAGIARFPDRVVLARSVNSTSALAANTLRTATFSATYTPDYDTPVVGFIMWQATTVPSLFGINVGHANLMGNPVFNGTSNTGQGTTPIAVGATMTAFTADTEIVYAYLT
jgi:hypothetical protein